jgi:membrane-associated protein
MQAVQFVLHLDQHMDALWAQYGAMLYVIVFIIVFAETGLVIAPWLPGDSLLFVLGAISALGGPDLGVLMLTLFVAAVLGNTSNYWIGRWVAPRLFHFENSRWFSHDALNRTHAFYEKYGGVTVVITRFLPLLRTFAPFVAGLGAMTHAKFQFYSVIGGALWVGLLVGAGYLFGQVPFIRANLALIMLGVVVVSFLPVVAGALRVRFKRSVDSHS